MSANYSKSDSISHRIFLKRREIFFATVLTLAAVAYTLASGQSGREKAPIALQGELKSIQ